MTDIQMEYGPRFGLDTGEETPWMGAGGGVVSQDVWGKHFEIARRGYVFAASNAATAVGTAFTTTPPFILWNPPNSNKNVSILRVGLAITTIQTANNALAYGLTPGQQTQPTTGTTLTPVATNGSGTVGSAKAFNASTLVAAPTLVMPSFALMFSTAANLNAALLVDDVNGFISISPGSAFAVQGIVAAGTGVGIISVAWAEVQIASG